MAGQKCTSPRQPHFSEAELVGWRDPRAARPPADAAHSVSAVTAPPTSPHGAHVVDGIYTYRRSHTLLFWVRGGARRVLHHPGSRCP